MEEVRELGRQAKRYPGLLVHVPTPDGGKVWIESGSKGFLVPHAAWVTVPDGRKRWITSNEEVAFCDGWALEESIKTLRGAGRKALCLTLGSTLDQINRETGRGVMITRHATREATIASALAYYIDTKRGRPLTEEEAAMLALEWRLAEGLGEHGEAAWKLGYSCAEHGKGRLLMWRHSHEGARVECKAADIATKMRLHLCVIERPWGESGGMRWRDLDMRERRAWDAGWTAAQEGSAYAHAWRHVMRGDLAPSGDKWTDAQRADYARGRADALALIPE
jgi:hypothetical protein